MNKIHYAMGILTGKLLLLKYFTKASFQLRVKQNSGKQARNLIKLGIAPSKIRKSGAIIIGRMTVLRQTGGVWVKILAGHGKPPYRLPFKGVHNYFLLKF